MKLAGDPERLLLPLHESVGAALAFVAGSNEVVRQEANADRVPANWNCEDEQPSFFVKLGRAFGHDQRVATSEHKHSPEEFLTVTRLSKSRSVSMRSLSLSGYLPSFTWGAPS